MDRNTLEAAALETINADDYYELADVMDTMTDAELLEIIKA